ncbi:MAG: hypothetical protein R3F62_04620 [Planctomycetota bacterium]
MLSRWPVERVGREALPRGPRGLEDYPRGVTWVRVRHPSGVVLDVGSLHLHQKGDAPDRALRVEQVRAAARSGFGGGAAARLLVGDYNARPGSPTLDAATALGWRDLWPEAEPGSPGYSGSVLGAGSPKRIDYVLAAPASGTVLRATRGELVGPRTNGDSGKLISDHKAVVVDLTLDVPVGP